jgi:osmotically-inducible protein OsmY
MKNIIFFVIFCGLAFTLFGDFDAQYNEEQEFLSNRPVTDEELLRNAIHKIIVEGGYERGHRKISVDLNNGDVTLKGILETWDEKNDLDKAIRKIIQVRSLTNEIRIRSRGYREDYDEYSQDPNSFTDELLRNNLYKLLEEGWFNRGYQQITVEVTDGNVILRGTVETWDDRNDIDEEIRKVNGVNSLNNLLIVKGKTYIEKDYNPFPQDEYNTAKDQYLTDQIRSKLRSGWLFGDYNDIQVNTERGVVTLEGSVGNRADEREIISEIQKIEGVHSVYSHLQIHPQHYEKY